MFQVYGTHIVIMIITMILIMILALD
jgi:hypothetical protein